MKIYTIGFTRKTAQQFFETLISNKVQLVVDIRLRPSGQLAGFAKQEDLPYFLDRLSNGCKYIHIPELAPTKDILDEYRDNHDWASYALRFENLLDLRDIPQSIDQTMFADLSCCLLCSEHSPEKCHRRLVAERLAA